MTKTRKLVALQPATQNVLALMLKHGDAKGFVDYHAADAAEPDWRSRVPKNYQQTMSGLRRSGRFDQMRRELSGVAEKPAHAHANGNGNGNGHAPVAAHTEEEIEQQVRARLEIILREASFCAKCGNNHGLVIRAAMMAAKLG